jgi:membrane-associated protease RseP (regulator of RpoE activity)
MKNIVFAAVMAAAFFGGCASHKTAEKEPKKIQQRPWIGGRFAVAPTPASVRTNGQSYGKHALLITSARADTPLAAAGLAEGDLALSIDGKKLKTAKDLHKAVEKSTGPLKFTIYRSGEISEKSVTPGKEKFQNWSTVSFGLGVSAHFEVDLFPNPNFSLVALGYEEKDKHLELNEAMEKYLRELHEKEGGTNGWQGLQSEEGWKTWLGPISVTRYKVIWEQEK